MHVNFSVKLFCSYWNSSCLNVERIKLAVAWICCKGLKSEGVHGVTFHTMQADWQLYFFFCIDLGFGQWPFEGIADWTYQQCSGPSCQCTASLPVQLWWGPTGQVLGSGIQQGKNVRGSNGEEEVTQNVLHVTSGMNVMKMWILIWCTGVAYTAAWDVHNHTKGLVSYYGYLMLKNNNKSNTLCSRDKIAPCRHVNNMVVIFSTSQWTK